ncbi:hypothetical protein ACFVQB_14545 [Paenibacillus sp. NPDC057886]|uniref:hypothetical protein n=1 Tax=Paenibacillus sp. NPDC057886 TaxID=3346270 RepID=UPI0036B291A4
MSKFKEFIKKVASKFSTPVKPLAAEVFEEESNLDIKNNLKEKLNIQIEDLSFKDSFEKLKEAINKFTINVDRIKSIHQENEEINKLQKIKFKTKSSRIKKKIQKRIDTYGK